MSLEEYKKKRRFEKTPEPTEKLTYEKIPIPKEVLVAIAGLNHFAAKISTDCKKA